LGAGCDMIVFRRFIKTLAPIFRIVIIMSLTLALIVNYCDDLNPMDKLRARVCSLPFLPPMHPIVFVSSSCVDTLAQVNATGD
jgi:hypothetical protein